MAVISLTYECTQMCLSDSCGMHTVRTTDQLGGFWPIQVAHSYNMQLKIH